MLRIILLLTHSLPHVFSFLKEQFMQINGFVFWQEILPGHGHRLIDSCWFSEVSSTGLENDV